MKRKPSPIHAPRGLRILAASLLAALSVGACGGGAQETPPAKTEAAPAPTASAAAAPDTSKEDAAKAEAIELCLATANAKRAKFSGEPPKVTVKHILVKYKGAKNADGSITRSREEACLRAAEARDKMVKDGADFDEVVKQYSEEAGAGTRGGMLGSIERKDVEKPFADAAFELGVNQLSDVVETPFGFHLIFRTE
jgi:parvulin-like peptidyl-prolyl isomerase